MTSRLARASPWSNARMLCFMSQFAFPLTQLCLKLVIRIRIRIWPPRRATLRAGCWLRATYSLQTSVRVRDQRRSFSVCWPSSPAGCLLTRRWQILTDFSSISGSVDGWLLLGNLGFSPQLWRVPVFPYKHGKECYSCCCRLLGQGSSLSPY